MATVVKVPDCSARFPALSFTSTLNLTMLFATSSGKSAVNLLRPGAVNTTAELQGVVASDGSTLYVTFKLAMSTQLAY